MPESAAVMTELLRYMYGVGCSDGPREALEDASVAVDVMASAAMHMLFGLQVAAEYTLGSMVLADPRKLPHVFAATSVAQAPVLFVSCLYAMLKLFQAEEDEGAEVPDEVHELFISKEDPPATVRLVRSLSQLQVDWGFTLTARVKRYLAVHRLLAPNARSRRTRMKK